MTSSSGNLPATTDGDSDSESVSSHQGPGPSKRKKYNQSFNNDWKGQMTWLSSSSRGSDYGFCMICNKHLSCSKGGIRDLKRHGETEVHRKRARSCEGQKTFTRLGVRLKQWQEKQQELGLFSLICL